MSGCGLGDAGDNNSVGDENIRNWKNRKKSRTNLYGVKKLIL